MPCHFRSSCDDIVRWAGRRLVLMEEQLECRPPLTGHVTISRPPSWEAFLRRQQAFTAFHTGNQANIMYLQSDSVEFQNWFYMISKLLLFPREGFVSVSEVKILRVNKTRASYVLF